MKVTRKNGIYVYILQGKHRLKRDKNISTGYEEIHFSVEKDK